MSGARDDEGLASAEADSATMLEAMTGSARPLGAKTGVASEATKTRSARPGMPEERMIPPEGSQVMLGPTVWP